MIIMLWGCDPAHITFGDEITTHRFENIPSSSLKQNMASLNGSGMRYTCWITTLNEPGSEEKYTHHSSVQFFADLDYTGGRNNRKQETVNWSFVVTYKAGSTGRNNWRHDGHENVIQRASCNLPDIPAVEKEMGRRLLKFEADHWLSDRKSSDRYKVLSKNNG